MRIGKGCTHKLSRAFEARMSVKKGEVYFYSGNECNTCGANLFYSKSNRCVKCKKGQFKSKAKDSRAEEARASKAAGETFFQSDKVCNSCGGSEFYSRYNKCVSCKRGGAKFQHLKRSILNIGGGR